MSDQQQPEEQERTIDQVQADILAAVMERDRARRPAAIVRGLDPANDSRPFDFVRLLADEWIDTAEDPDRRAALVKFLTDSIDIRDLLALRRAAEAAAAVTVQRIRADADNGVRPADIARFLHVTESYVYRVLREQRTAK